MTQHYSQVRHPVRKIPTREQIEEAARRQAAYEASMRAADASYSGHDAGIHPEHRPYMSTELSQTPVTFDAEGEYDIEEDEAYYRTQLPTSTRRSVSEREYPLSCPVCGCAKAQKPPTATTTATAARTIYRRSRSPTQS